MHVSSSDASVSSPVMVVVRQPKQVLSWQVPLGVDNETGTAYFRDTARTLCYDEGWVEDNPIVSVSTSYNRSVNFTLLVEGREEFLIEPGRFYEVEISPTEPMFYFYNFSTNFSDTERNFETVILEIESHNNVCMVASIQNASVSDSFVFNKRPPPMFVLVPHHGFESRHNLQRFLRYRGQERWHNDHGNPPKAQPNTPFNCFRSQKDKFPKGFYTVFVAKGCDHDCTGNLEDSSTNRKKHFQFRIIPSISRNDYVSAVFITLGCIGAFYVMFATGFFFCSRRGFVPRAMQFVEETDLVSTPTTVNSIGEDNISLDETEYDTADDVQFDREIFLNKPLIYLSDLARKDPRVLTRKSYLYLYNVLTVAVFYGLPVVQLVWTYQKVLNKTGQQDLCYYNFLCAHPLGFFSDFNHLFSNIGYVLFGVLFLGITHRRERLHQDLNFDRVS